MRRIAIGSVALLWVLVRSAPSASTQDMAEMSKWAGAKLIHWHLVGEFNGLTTMIPFSEGPVKVSVSDRIEIDFDWDNATIVGKPVIKNFPSKSGPPKRDGGCQDVKVNGTFEYFTLDAINPSALMLMLQGKQDRPAGSVPKSAPNDQDTHPCGFYGWVNVAASAPAVPMTLQLPPAMMLAMPATPGFEMEFTKDHKSFIQKLNTDGWVWTMTPTIVK